MKKLVILMLCGALGMGLGAAPQVQYLQTAGAKEAIVGSPKLAVLVDGRKVKFQGGDPVSENGRIQVPLRGIGEALGANVEYDRSGKKVTYTKDNKSIVLAIGSKQATVDGRAVTMDTVAKAVKGRTYVPLRFVSENLGETVEWDQAANWVWVGKKEIPSPEEAGVKNVPISEFTKLIGDHTWVLTSVEGTKYTTVNVIKADQLPLKIGDRVIYDIWPVKQGSIEGLKIHASDGSPNLVFLGSQFDARSRNPRTSLSVTNTDKTRTLTYAVRSGHDVDIDPNFKNFKLAQVEYIVVAMSSNALTVIENPFK
ncbi:copper amine oxidase N-terminal domain-containing protein [Paenibacillus sanguinis]|uniref:copper amine oxidase N-terminal domain-containing protein n=1 Tax=Paenibacillus sanguinis TaxID=225906 RepID=UPI000364692D|nr:copper amine oxidase N-terminal domain-containing protein [Paenibacillus sanguinis]